MAPRLRVFQLITALQHGGAENMLVDLVGELDEVECMIGYMGSEDDLVPVLRERGVPVKSFGERFRFDPLAIARLRRFLRSESFDVLHAHLPYAQTVGRIAARGLVDGIVSTQHNVATNYHPVTRATERLTRPFDDATVAVSNGVERSFTGTAHSPDELGDPWCTIYNGIDVEAFRREVDAVDTNAMGAQVDIDPENLTFLNVGRYVPVKNQRSLIRAFDRAHLEADLLVVGAGPLEDELRDFAMSLGIEGRVHITGRVPEVHPYYAASDVFVSPSRGEGLPITLLEAMSAKLPVVASDIPGSREVVADSRTGLLYPPDDEDEMIAAMEQLRDLQRRQALGTAGYERVRDVFSVERMAGSYGDLYERVVSR